MGGAAIATVTTLLQRRTQIHQAQLGEHVNSLSFAYHNMIAGTQAKLLLAGSSVYHSGSQATGMVYGTVQRQAAMLAFIDNFHLLGIVFFVVIPVLMLLKKPPKGVSAPVH